MFFQVVVLQDAARRAKTRRSGTNNFFIVFQLICLLLSFVIPKGFEPLTHSLEGCCSIQLSYGTGTAKIVNNLPIGKLTGA